MAVSRLITALTALTVALYATSSAAIDVASTATALRLANTITGGYMPTSDPLFSQMVTKVQAGDLLGAASLATNSNYFASYMARRLAFQMQNPTLNASASSDSDATAFIVAHFVGTAQTSPSISTLWSENATYMVNVSGTGPTHAASLSPAQLSSVNWSASLTQVQGQNAVDLSGNPTAIPQKHVGGYLTLSDRVGDNSFAMYGATAGTNLRMIEGVWEISTGLTLLDVASTSATAQEVPRFVPEYDPNFFHGQGQAACISCHGGGMSSLDHGYATVADVFNFDPNNGFTYIASPTTATRKSLGSNASDRQTNLTCNLVQNPTAVCNPDSLGVDPNQAWNLQTVWSQSGVLNTMGWTGPTTGQGLNALGSALGQAAIVYQFLTERVVNEVCPMGEFTATDVAMIASAANPFAQPAGTDDIRTIVAMVAANPSCQ